MKTKIRICLDCGKDISEKQIQAKRCDGCRKTHKNEISEVVREFNKIGTTNFSSHANRNENGNIDFKRESEIVHNEKKAVLGKNPTTIGWRMFYQNGNNELEA